MYMEDDGFSPYFGYTGGRLGDVDNQGVEASDWVEVKGIKYAVCYYNYPRKNLEKLTVFDPTEDEGEGGLAILISHASGQNGISITRKDKQSYEFHSSGKLANWEEANPSQKNTGHRMEAIKRIFELFYQKLAEKYDIKGYVEKYEEIAQQQLKEAEGAESRSEEFSGQFEGARKKHIDALKGTPDPLEEMFL